MYLSINNGNEIKIHHYKPKSTKIQIWFTDPFSIFQWIKIHICQYDTVKENFGKSFHVWNFDRTILQGSKKGLMKHQRNIKIINFFWVMDFARPFQWYFFINHDQSNPLFLILKIIPQFKYTSIQKYNIYNRHDSNVAHLRTKQHYISISQTI